MSDSGQPHRWQPTRLPHPWDSPGKNTGVGCHFLLQRMKVKSESEVAQSCPTLSDPMDCSLPGSSIHGIFQARVLEWGAIAFSAPIVREMQIKTTVRSHLTPVRMAIIKKSTNSKCWRGCGGKKACLHWRRKWQPTPVILSGGSRGQRSLVSCSPWGHKSRTGLSD